MYASLALIYNSLACPGRLDWPLTAISYQQVVTVLIMLGLMATTRASSHKTTRALNRFHNSSNTNWVRRFRCEDRNVNLTTIACDRWSLVTNWGEVARRSSWAIELLAVRLNNISWAELFHKPLLIDFDASSILKKWADWKGHRCSCKRIKNRCVQLFWSNW